MADDKSKRGEEDRRSVAESEPYEVAYFARKHGITTAQAMALIEAHGNDRAVLDAAAERLKAGSKD